MNEFDPAYKRRIQTIEEIAEPQLVRRRLGRNQQACGKDESGLHAATLSKERRAVTPKAPLALSPRMAAQWRGGTATYPRAGIARLRGATRLLLSAIR
ncbi:hypothetical protein Busp01_04830 [Trinickia caryophylli]|nr:hypothetical protein Busp01_04830 [Trinickia caryophylli]